MKQIANAMLDHEYIRDKLLSYETVNLLDLLQNKLSSLEERYDQLEKKVSILEEKMSRNQYANVTDSWFKEIKKNYQ